MRRVMEVIQPRARRRLGLIALLIGFVAVVGAWRGAHRAHAATLAELIRTGVIPSKLTDVPSHNRRYRASLRPSRGTTMGDVAEWSLHLERADGTRVPNATLALQAWMPDAPTVERHRPSATAAGGGTYRVIGLRFDRPGWWNVRLTVTRAGITDSLAFNLVMPSASTSDLSSAASHD